MRRSTLITLLAAVMVMAMALGASAAFAGEVTGNGNSLKNADGSLNGHSACAFSGLNDTYTPGEPDAEGFLRTQNWGQLPKTGDGFWNRENLTSIGLNPGVACRGNAAASH